METAAAAPGASERAHLGHPVAEGAHCLTMALDISSRPAGYSSAPPRPTRPVTRQGRTEDLRRARATAQVLRIAFPQVEHLRIELAFTDASSVTPAAQVHTLYPPARAFFTYRCPHSDCDGEFELTDIIRKVVSEPTHEARGSLACTGVRPGEKSSKRACELRLGYAISARLNGSGA